MVSFLQNFMYQFKTFKIDKTFLYLYFEGPQNSLIVKLGRLKRLQITLVTNKR